MPEMCSRDQQETVSRRVSLPLLPVQEEDPPRQASTLQEMLLWTTMGVVVWMIYVVVGMVFRRMTQ